jgi:hypothetical protein
MTNQPVRFEKKSTRKITNKKQEILYRLWLTGAVIGFLGGTGSLMASIILTACDFLSSDKPRGSWLFLAVLPLWFLGAHSLDKAEEAESTYP